MKGFRRRVYDVRVHARDSSKPIELIGPWHQVQVSRVKDSSVLLATLSILCHAASDGNLTEEEDDGPVKTNPNLSLTIDLTCS